MSQLCLILQLFVCTVMLYAFLLKVFNIFCYFIYFRDPSGSHRISSSTPSMSEREQQRQIALKSRQIQLRTAAAEDNDDNHPKIFEPPKRVPPVFTFLVLSF